MDRRASFWIRLASLVLDLLVILLFGVLVGTYMGNSLAEFYFMGFLEEGVGLEAFDNMGPVFGSLAGIMIVALIMMIVEGVSGVSFGKFLCRLRTMDADGNKIGNHFIRTSLKYVIPITSFVAGISGVLVLASVGQILGIIVFLGGFLSLSGSRLNLLDIITKSSVVRKV